MSKALLFNIVKQILVNLVVHLFMRGGFRSMEHRSPCNTQLPFVIHYHVIHLPCNGSCVSQGGGQLRIRKEIKTLYGLKKKCNEDNEISLNKICYT